MADLAVIILTHNEEKHIGRALHSVRRLCRRIFVVDSYSTDRTVEIARQYGAVVLQNRFVNYASQFSWALRHGETDCAWIMRLDADEIVEPDLAAEIEATLPTLGREVAGINLKRKHIFMGRWIRHGGRYPLLLLRIWRRGQGRIEDRWMDEHMIVQGGGTVTLEGGFADHNLNDLTFFTDKHNRYATREAIDVLMKRYGAPRTQAMTAQETSFQAAAKRTAKEQFYNRLPIWVGPAGYFVFRYVFQLGFLDGPPGLVYHVLQGFWYRFLVAAKVLEYEEQIGHLGDARERMAELARLTGYRAEDIVPETASATAS